MTIATGNVTTVAGNVYASSGNTVITFMSICNYSTGNVQANVWVVPAGGAVGNLTAVIANINLTPHDTYQFYQANEKLILGNNDAIQANASANNSITIITSYTSA